MVKKGPLILISTVVVLFFVGFSLSYFLLDCPSGLCEPEIMSYNEIKDDIQKGFEDGESLFEISNSSYNGWNLDLTDPGSDGWSDYGRFQTYTDWILNVFSDDNIQERRIPDTNKVERKRMGFSIHAHRKFHEERMNVFINFTMKTRGDHMSPNYEMFFENEMSTFVYASYFIDGKLNY